MKLTEQQLQLLNQLEDIQLPDPIGWWPLSSAVWVVIFTVSTLLIALIWVYFNQKKRNAYRTEALAILNTVENSSNNANQQILEINTLLKQVALTRYQRSEVARLNEAQWLAFLHKTASHVKQPSDLLEALKQAYQAPSQDPIKQQESQYALHTVKNYAREWIKGHHQ